MEFGAGAGLPGLVSAILGAKAVCVTDYPDAELVQNLESNVVGCQGLWDSKVDVVAEVSRVVLDIWIARVSFCHRELTGRLLSLYRGSYGDASLVLRCRRCCLRKGVGLMF